MFEQDFLTRAQYESGRASRSPTAATSSRRRSRTREYPYFTSWIKQQVVDQLGGGQEGARHAFEGGLTVKTTIDSQAPGRRPGRDQPVAAERTAGPRAALVAIDNKHGEVARWSAATTTRSAPFNLATQGQRQPGSAFKPFVLAQALAHGISPDSPWASQEADVYVPQGRREVHRQQLRGRLRRLTHARAARPRSPTTPSSPRSASRSARARSPAGAPHGHPHAGLAQLRDALGGLQAGRHAARHGARVRDVRQRRQARLRHAQPGREQPSAAGARPGRHRARSTARATARPSRRAPTASARVNRKRSARARHERRRAGRLDPADASSATAPARARRSPACSSPARPARPRTTATPGSSAGRKELHRRGLGRLPGPAQADGDRVPGRAGRRRHLPGRDLADVHGGAGRCDDRCAGRRRDAPAEPRRRRGRRPARARRPAPTRRRRPRRRRRRRRAPRADAPRSAGRRADPRRRRPRHARRPSRRRAADAGGTTGGATPPAAARPAPRAGGRGAARSPGGHGRETLREPRGAEAPRQLGRLRDPDPRARRRSRRPPSPAARGPIRTGPSSEVGAVVLELDAERLGELARARAEVLDALAGRGARASRRCPSSGSSARISTAAPTPSGSQTALSSAWMP